MGLAVMFRKSPFARFLVFYVAGILVAKGLYNKVWISIELLYILVGSFTILLIIIDRFPVYYTGLISGIITSVILFLLGLMNMNIHFKNGIHMQELTGKKAIFVMKVAESPELKDKSVKAVMHLMRYAENGEWKANHQKVLAYFEKDTLAKQLMPGHTIAAQGMLTGIDPPDNPGEFNYRNYMADRDIYNQIYLASGTWHFCDQVKHESVRIYAYKIQHRLLHTYDRIGLNHTLYGILSALTLGYKNDLEVHTRQVFAKAGVMHVMALSGFNVAVIAVALGYALFFFDRFRYGRIGKTLIIIMVIWFFVLVTGVSPSVTRAAVMITFVMTGKLLQRKVNTYNILFASAFLLLTLSPALISDISFQLSFAAVFGILFFHSPLYHLISFKFSILSKLWQLFTVSCAAQLATLPLTLYYFHQFPVYFWLTNLFVVPMVSLIIYLTGVFLLCSAIDPLAFVLGKAITFLVKALYESVSFTEILPCAVIQHIFINEFQAVILAVVVGLSGLFLLYRRRVIMIVALGMIVVFQLMSLRHNILIRDQHVLMVNNLRKSSLVTVLNGRNCLLYTNSSLTPWDPSIKYILEQFWIEHGVADRIQLISSDQPTGLEVVGMDSSTYLPWLGKNVLIRFAGERVIILNDTSIYQWHSKFPLPVHMVIVSGNVRPDKKAVQYLMKPEMLILDSSVRNRQARLWSALCENEGIMCWNVTQQGAFTAIPR